MIKSVKELYEKSEEEVLNFIRKRLANNPDDTVLSDHKRFEMSGYEYQVGKTVLHNLSILNEFADLGIYDYTTYLFLDFYKGTGTLYYQYFRENENLESDFGGHTTSQIIYEIFKLTIFSTKSRRRRN